MKAVKIILFVLCFLQILFPFIDYFLYQWRNDNRYALISTLELSYDLNGSYLIYPQEFSPNSFSEFIIYNYDQATVTGTSYTSKGIQKDVTLFVLTVNQYLSGAFIRKGVVDVFSSCIILCRSVSLFLAYGFLYIITLPVFLCYDIFIGGKKREKF